jgi:hypothetical protein
MSTSTRVAPPPGTSATGGPTVAALTSTSSVARPVRPRPWTFWNAITALVVLLSNTPSTAPTS